MNPLWWIVIVLVIIGLPSYRYAGDHGPYVGGGFGLVVLILVILLLTGRL